MDSVPMVNDIIVIWDFQQCGILSVDPKEHVRPLLSLETPNDVPFVA